MLREAASRKEGATVFGYQGFTSAKVSDRRHHLSIAQMSRFPCV
jgi:hypothetical protein